MAWAPDIARSAKGVDCHPRGQPPRASQPIPLNIAEGNGKGTNAADLA